MTDATLSQFAAATASVRETARLDGYKEQLRQEWAIKAKLQTALENLRTAAERGYLTPELCIQITTDVLREAYA